jgi:uncharacterized tellurite resistance protein B-like protein
MLDFLGFRRPEPHHAAGQTETVRKIVEALDRMEPENARFLAAFAYILSRVARADLKVTPEETRAMERIVMEQGALPEEQAVIVVQIAKHQSVLFGGTENFLVTREFNKISTGEQKIALLDCLFRVAAAGDMVSVSEDNEIRQIADELGLTHEQFIAVRSRYRDQLAVLQKNHPPAEPSR